MKMLENTSAKPFVKWVGGKTQLLNEVQRSLPEDLSGRNDLIYVEPFVGGGAVLFWILQKYPNIKRAVINDINSELICTYRTIKNNLCGLIGELKALQSAYIPLGMEGRKQFYLQKRDMFNSKTSSEVQSSALFIFLNRTCFNGLYRVNSNGEFNVPHGKYANPLICDEQNLEAVSSLLQKVEILCGDFSLTGTFAGVNTLYYFDPPYKPLNETSSFTSYAKGGFNDKEQIRLRDFCYKIAESGSLFIASNSDPQNCDPTADFFDSLYDKFKIKRVLASRMINSNVEGRGKVSEIMISNIY